MTTLLKRLNFGAIKHNVKVSATMILYSILAIISMFGIINMVFYDDGSILIMKAIRLGLLLLALILSVIIVILSELRNEYNHEYKKIFK